MQAFKKKKWKKKKSGHDQVKVPSLKKQNPERKNGVNNHAYMQNSWQGGIQKITAF
jgi:hypothetical protein